MTSTVQEQEHVGRGHQVTVTVNNKPVVVTGPRVTGLQVKEAAIEQKVQIELDFLLSLELPNGETQIVGDSDTITVNKHSKFTAVADDDNS